MPKHLTLRKFLKIAGPITLVGAASVPLTLVLTSCAPVLSSSWKQFDLSDTSKDANWNGLSSSKQDLETLANGTKKVHSGNYIIIFGSNTSKNCNNFLTGINSSWINPSNDAGGYPFGGVFTNCLNSASTTYKNNVDFGLYLYMDIETQSMANNNPLNKGNALAYDYKWTDDEQKQYAKYVDDDDQTTVKSGKYARNDDSATDMRDLLKFMSTLLGDKFKVDSADSLPYAIIWKDGKPKTDDFKSLKTEDDFQKLLDEFTKTKD